MAFSGDRIPGASGPTGVGPASQRGSLVLRGRRSVGSRLQGRAPTVNRRHSVRHGSEQRTSGHPSLGGSRGGGGTRDSPRSNVRAIPGVHLYTPERLRCVSERRLVSALTGSKRQFSLPCEPSNQRRLPDAASLPGGVRADNRGRDFQFRALSAHAWPSREWTTESTGRQPHMVKFLFVFALRVFRATDDVTTARTHVA